MKNLESNVVVATRLHNSRLGDSEFLSQALAKLKLRHEAIEKHQILSQRKRTHRSLRFLTAILAFTTFITAGARVVGEGRDNHSLPVTHSETSRYPVEYIALRKRLDSFPSFDSESTQRQLEAILQTLSENWCEGNITIPQLVELLPKLFVAVSILRDSRELSIEIINFVNVIQHSTEFRKYIEENYTHFQIITEIVKKGQQSDDDDFPYYAIYYRWGTLDAESGEPPLDVGGVPVENEDRAAVLWQALLDGGNWQLGKLDLVASEPSTQQRFTLTELGIADMSLDGQLLKDILPEDLVVTRTFEYHSAHFPQVTYVLESFNKGLSQRAVRVTLYLDTPFASAVAFHEGPYLDRLDSQHTIYVGRGHRIVFTGAQNIDLEGQRQLYFQIDRVFNSR